MLLHLRGSRPRSSGLVAEIWWICWRALLVTGVRLLVFLLAVYTIQIFMTSLNFLPFTDHFQGAGWWVAYIVAFMWSDLVYLELRSSAPFPRYLYVACWPVGVYLLGKLLDGIWVGSWRWLQHFCCLALVKTLNIFWFWEKKGRKQRIYGSDYSSLRFQLMAGRLFSVLCQVE